MNIFKFYKVFNDCTRNQCLTRFLFRSSIISFFLITTFLLTVHCKKDRSNKVQDTTGINKGDTIMDTISGTIIPDTLKKQAIYLFAGTYSGNNSKGIYVFEMDSVTGNLSLLSTQQTSNASYLCIHPNKKWLYAVGENDNGTVNSYEFDTVQKKLRFKNSVSAKGKAPCYVSVDKSGKFVMVANYNSGNVVLFPIKEDGSLDQASSVIQHTGKSINNSRQTSPHAHMIAEEANNIVYATDLGIDKIMHYKIDAQNKNLKPTGSTLITAGSGPRHFVMHPSLNTFYVLNELKGSIESFNVKTNDGSLSHFQIFNMKNGDTRYPGSADIHISPNGKFLYASNRGDMNTIGMYTINQNTGALALIGFQSVKGKAPRNFVISSSGKYLFVANQESGNIVLFEIASNGTLIDKNIEIEVPNVVCLKFL